MREAILKTTVVAAVTAFGAQAHAQEFSGSAGLQIGGNKAVEYDRSSREITTVGAAVLNGRFAYETAGAMTYAGDFFLRYDDFANGTEGDFNSDEDPETRGQFGLQALYDLTDATRAGVFIGYANQRSQRDNVSDDYDTWLVGLTGQVDLSENFLGYGQVGYGDNTQGDDNGEGFVEGSLARAGLVYFVSDATIVNVDMQFAGTPTYIDNDAPGVFNSFELSSETQIVDSLPISAEFGVRRSVINSTDEGDHLSEIEAFVGVTYNFGGKSVAAKWRDGVAYGTPDLPARASAWTEWAD